MGKRKAVVTGIGLVSPLGSDRETTFAGLLEGRSGAGPITRFDASGYPVRFACEVKDFWPEERLGTREARRMDLFTQFAVAASEEALADSGLELEKEDLRRVGVILGTGIGGITELEAQKVVTIERGPSRVSPLLVPKMMFNAHTGQVALRFGFQGPNYAVGSACASACHAIGVALRNIQLGEAEVVLTGGSEAAVTTLAVAGFANMKALSRRNDDPTRASRPFDAGRDGFVLGEGAGILVLEEEEHARRRGARIYAEVLGFGATDDAFHITAPDESGEGPARAVRLALKDAGVDPGEVGYVNAHGTSTELNDKMETRVLKKVFGDHARNLWVNSTKSMLGHLLGASGGVEFATTCLSLHRGVFHPTINQETPDPDCDLDSIPNEAREGDIRLAICNSFGFGGTNACLVAGRSA